MNEPLMILDRTFELELGGVTTECFYATLSERDGKICAHAAESVEIEDETVHVRSVFPHKRYVTVISALEEIELTEGETADARKILDNFKLRNAGGYPNHPGNKEKGGTSESAARSMSGVAGLLRDRVLACIASSPQTADEVADKLGESVLSVRPRVSELFALGLIVRLSETRKNISGRQARVWASANK